MYSYLMTYTAIVISNKFSCLGHKLKKKKQFAEYKTQFVVINY